MEKNNELLDSQNETENLDSQIEEAPEVDVEALKQEKEKLAEQNKQLFERAKKAELALKTKPAEKEEAPKTESKSEYSLQDIRALSDVHDEDVQEVVDFAKFKGISITEAKKNPTVQTILKQKTEERTTAEATNTAVSRKGASKVSSEDLLDKFNQGDVPEKEEDLKKVIEARWTAKEK
jgi:hypothetical protein